jgi:hypothetical protein
VNLVREQRGRIAQWASGARRADFLVCSHAIHIRSLLKKSGLRYALAEAAIPPLTCMVEEYDLLAEGRELQEAEPTLSHSEIFKRVIHKDRYCAAWEANTLGQTPQWHLQKRLDMRLEKERREHDLKLAEMTLRSQESLQAIMAAHKQVTDKLADIAARSEASDAKFQGTDTLFKWLFGVMAFLTLMVGVVGLLPVYDRVTGRDAPIRVDVTVTQPTPSTVDSPP